ncbi:MAG: type II toxin-antitoxin system VapC family toxin [Pyrinomonadaceae bacterium]
MSKKETVYIETTVVSYLTAWLSRDLIRAAHQQITQEWWHNRREDFEIFVSEFVINEASAGDAEAAGKRLAALENVALLDVTLAVENLAKMLIADKALPPRAATDALHIAVAAVHGIDYLLSWNCKHIANAEMQDTIEKVCRESGCKCPKICTPEELLGGKYDLE